MAINRTACRTPVHSRVLYAVLFWLYPWAVTQAQTNFQPDYKIAHYSTENGLIQNSARDLLLDTNGFLWIATQGGLCRFDGMRFRLYNSSNTPMLADRVSHLMQTSSGKVLVRLAFERRIVYRINKDYQLEKDTGLSTGAPVFYGNKSDAVRMVSPRGTPLPAFLMGDISNCPGCMSVDEHRFYYFHNGQVQLFDNTSGLSMPCTALDTILLTAEIDGLYLCFDSRFNAVAIRDGMQLPEAPMSPAFRNLMRRVRADRDPDISFFRNDHSTALIHYNGEIWKMSSRAGTLDVSLLYSGFRFSPISSLLYDSFNDILYVGTDIDGLYVVSKNPFRTIILDEKVGYRNDIYSQIRVSKDFVVNQYYRYDPLRNIRFPLEQKIPICAFYKTSEGYIVYSNQQRIFFADSLMRKRTGFGTNNYATKSVVLHVAPFWYETVTFYLLLVLGLMGLVYYVFKSRERAFRKRKALLEQTVQDRTADLNKTVRELHESEQILSNINLVQEQVISAILHDVQTPLRFMSSSALHFNRNLAHFSMKEISEFAGALSHSASEINNFTNDLLQWLIYQQGNPGINTERIDARELLQEICNLYQDIATFDGNRMELEDNGPVWVVTDRNKLKLVIRNLADNANKNCREGYIRLSARAVPDTHTVELSVEDSGNGMSEEKIRELLNNVHGAHPSFKKGKLGYVLIRDFLNIIGGRLFIRSEKGAGTVVSVVLPESMQEQ